MTTAPQVLRRGLDALGLTLPDEAVRQLAAYADLLRAANARHNLIARTDLDAVEERHVLHCLELARWPVAPGETVVDWGTGGGLPLVPMAVAFPEVQFVGVDAVEKKVRSVRRMIRELGLANADALHARAEEVRLERTLSVSRATAPLATLWSWHAAQAGPLEAPLRCLKGGDLADEIADLKAAFDVRVETHPLRLPYDWASTKCVVTVTPSERRAE
jgi:16S rRNA (guanine527-N7)-methyltransferase